MPCRPEIETLIRQVARRHDGFLARRIVIICLLAGSGAVIALSLIWVLRGHSAPVAVPLSGLGVAVISALEWWFAGRMRTAQAVREADRIFGLKDGISSARHLQESAPESPRTQLQWQWLAPRLAECRAETITRPFPKLLAAISVFLLILSIWLSLLPASPAIRSAEEASRVTRERMKESKEELEKLVDALDDEATTPEEKDALRMDEFRKLVKELDETGDRMEVARQFARIEQKLRDVSQALDQKRDEETVKMAAAELAKAEETEARQLGKKLEAKELKDAAEMLEKLAAKEAKPADPKDAATKQKAITEAKEQLARLRAASKRMAAAGKQRQAARQAQGGGAAGMSSGSLEDMMADLDADAAAGEKQLAEFEFDPNLKFDPNCASCANASLARLGKHLRGMHSRRIALNKLNQLRVNLNEARSFSQGQCQSLAFSQTPGGSQAGVGSSWNERQERDDSQKNGSLALLQGQHGSGPSMSSVEDAESGSGVSGRRGEARQREFARQVESFVQRDDVPESLKLGVRNYFENLQSSPAEPSPE
ncbi:MAG: hypothetical protein QM627_09195 [Luteolibacter sp.]